MGTVAITGSASGIGAAIKARFEAEGHEVIGVDLRNADVEADLSTPSGRDTAVAGILDRSGGRLDRVVLCAGLGSNVRPASLVCKVNYFGTLDVLDPLRPALEKGDAPNAVVIVSNSAQMADVGEMPFVKAMLDHDEAETSRIIDEMDSPILAYMGSKHALGRALRRRAGDWGRAGVRLNGVCPGPVKTPLLQGTLDDPATRDSIAALDIPLGRLGEPDDVAKLVWFLASDDASWIHGSIIYVDGGTDATIRPERY